MRPRREAPQSGGFDYSGQPHPTIPLVDTARERHDMWLLKRYGLPFLSWHLMLRGLA